MLRLNVEVCKATARGFGFRIWGKGPLLWSAVSWSRRVHGERKVHILVSAFCMLWALGRGGSSVGRLLQCWC